MYLLTNEKTTIFQSTNKDPSLHCYHKQAWVKWSNCPFSPLPILSLPPLYSSDHWLRLQLSISESLALHTSHISRLWLSASRRQTISASEE